MKTRLIIIFILIYSLSLMAQIPIDFQPPFQFGKYVHYNKIITNITQVEPTVTYGDDLDYRSNEAQDDYSHYASVDLYIKYGKCNHKLTKPFVFVEGVSFDKQSVRSSFYSFKDYWDENINSDPEKPNTQLLTDVLNNFKNVNWGENPGVGYSTFNWATLVTGIDVEGLSDGEPLQVQKSPELLQKLYDSNYDVVFVDFKSGQNYMENNGFALSKALKLIKDSLDNNESPEKLVVCGACMGGLVSRFAIRDLELNGADKYKTCVGKFISFDAPQMGANINLGMQYLLQNFSRLQILPGSNTIDQINEIVGKYSKLTCPSASQLVLYSCLPDPIDWYWPMKWTTASQSMERLLFNLHPNVSTWPTNCRNISIINGSRNGNKQNYGSVDACERLFDGDGLVSLDIKSLPNYNDGYCKIYDFELPTVVCQPAWDIMAQAVSNNSVRVKESRGVDIVAGSYRTDLAALSVVNHWISSVIAGVVAPCNLISYFTPSTGSAPNYCFIPALSAAGVKNFDGLVENSHIALPQIFQGSAKFEDPNHNVSNFDVVYAPATNQTHVEITDENIRWVMYELLDIEDEHLKFQNEYIEAKTHKAEKTIRAGSNVGKYTDASFETNQIEGIILQPANLPAPTFLSIGTSVSIFVAEGQDEGEMYDAFSQQNLPFKSYAVSFIGLNSEFILGEAEIQSSSPYCYISKTLGSSQFDGIGNEFINNIFYFNFATPFCDYCGPAIVRGNGSITKFFAGESISLEPGFYTEDNAHFEASIINFESDCIPIDNSGGRFSNTATNTIQNSNENTITLKKTILRKNSKNENVRRLDLLEIFPNPAQNNFTIGASESICQFSIYDISGKLVLKQENVGLNKTEVSVENMQAGIYFVKIITPNQNETKKLMIAK
jgi:hypothetical protein